MKVEYLKILTGSCYDLDGEPFSFLSQFRALRPKFFLVLEILSNLTKGNNIL